VYFNTDELNATTVLGQFAIPTLYNNQNPSPKTWHSSIGIVTFSIRPEQTPWHGIYGSDITNEAEMSSALGNAELGKYTLVFNARDNPEITRYWNAQYVTKVPHGILDAVASGPKVQSSPQGSGGDAEHEDTDDQEGDDAIVIQDVLPPPSRKGQTQQEDASGETRVSVMTRLLEDGYVTRRQFIGFIHRLGAPW
jgi:hypothetical protein